MRLVWRALGWVWNIFGTITVAAVAYQLGSSGGYGRGARDIARLMIEMRQAAYETPEPWDSGGI